MTASQTQLEPGFSEALAAFQGGDLERARKLAEPLAARFKSAQLQHLLGLIHCRQGQMKSGLEWLRKASEAEPSNIGFRVMLSRALVDSGRPADALDVAERPTGTTPADMALWHVRAEAAQALSDYAHAAEAWEVLCVARPDDWRAWANYGDAMAGLERWEEAANAYRRACTLNPNEFPLRQNFASALAHAGLYEEAVEELRRLLVSGHDDAGTRLTLSRLLADLGRQEESIAELEEAARLATGGSASGQENADLIRIALPNRDDPTAPFTTEEQRALRELALLLERTNRLDALRALLDDAERLGISREQLGMPAAAVALREGDAAEAKRLLEEESSEEEPVRWHRLMAKILDALGDAQGAFDAAEIMHRSVQDYDGWVERSTEYRRRIRSLADAITPQWAASIQPPVSHPRRSPAFLVGFPRSGTTLLDTFLMGHPETVVLEEFHMLGAAETVLGNVAELPDRSPEQLEQARQAYFAELDRHADRDFPGLIVDKLPLNMLGLSVIHCLFPDARVIFAQRHPCDVVLSGIMQSFVMNDAMACYLSIDGAADFYDAALEVWTRSREAIPASVYTSIYEELIADPEASLRPLLDFLGLEWHDEVLDHQSTATKRGAIITPSYDQVIQPLDKAPSGRWRRYEKQLEPVLPVLLPWAKRLGYAD